MKLKDKVALITGTAAPKGLGKAIAVAMAREGAKIAVCDINEEGVIQSAKDIEATGAQALGLRCDVSDVESVRETFSKVIDRYGTLDILVNNAALIPTKPADTDRRNRHYAYMTTPIPRQSIGITSSLTDDDWLRWWGVNVHGVFYCTREALKIMEPAKYGRIVNIASTGGISVMSGHSPGYSASKAAVVSFTKTVAQDVAGAGIFVNCIAPGGIHTDDFEGYLSGLTDVQRNTLWQIMPAGRLGKPEEYAALAVHLASDETYCVGQIISPNGGLVF
ncbi:SDR family NAD(P)-dependent oxidoreductase [Mesorhizobium sp. B1-1-8]|uniref:SDR family NAD(P)-dependent oxidoreductase n=1 Tax=Mesorhizobium sp. B1-1-8 TaxID=2589976 RepID=UPI0011294235|nr:SDR family oxidoreductase [Mesorhizobium sp. B1-1-8]UCI05649.1 SDR family oxidoreductase [Mesorhizobium sp. B1-1-8]